MEYHDTWSIKIRIDEYSYNRNKTKLNRINMKITLSKFSSCIWCVLFTYLDIVHVCNAIHHRLPKAKLRGEFASSRLQYLVNIVDYCRTKPKHYCLFENHKPSISLVSYFHCSADFVIIFSYLKPFHSVFLRKRSCISDIKNPLFISERIYICSSSTLKRSISHKNTGTSS
jgi:hypothetical protein